MANADKYVATVGMNYIEDTKIAAKIRDGVEVPLEKIVEKRIEPGDIVLASEFLFADLKELITLGYLEELSIEKLEDLKDNNEDSV